MCPGSGTVETLLSRPGGLPGGDAVSSTLFKKRMKKLGLRLGNSEGRCDHGWISLPSPLSSRLPAVEKLRTSVKKG